MPRPGLASRLLYRVYEAILKNSPLVRMVFTVSGVTKCNRQAGSLCSFGAYILALDLVWGGWILLCAYICIHLKGQERAKGQRAYDSALGSLNRTLSQLLLLNMLHRVIHSNCHEGKHSLRAHVCQAADWSLVIKRAGQVQALASMNWV